jgi:AraC-like DNA-binding protein
VKHTAKKNRDMPIYMDRHDVSETVTAENVAQIHQQDLKIQDNYSCRALTYWFDEKRKTAFCLIEAPNEQALKEMHYNAHGNVPHIITEVDVDLVESFLGRIEDPQNPQNTDLNIINDPAFRIIMVAKLKVSSLKLNELIRLNKSLATYNKKIPEVFEEFDGSIVKHYRDGFLVSFKSVTDAVQCAIENQAIFKKLTCQQNPCHLKLKIGLCAGSPITENKELFAETVQSAERLTDTSKADIVVSSEVKDLYINENSNQFVKNKQVEAISPSDEHFIKQLIDFAEKESGNTQLKVKDFNLQLGFSKSQLYRKMITLMGISPNNFLLLYRLNKALGLFNKKSGNISEIAYETGFNSPSYFSKCFKKRFGILPSDYLETSDKPF